MSTFTGNLGLENPAYLSQTNTWGTTENTGRSIVDNAVAGRATFNLTTTSFSISITNGTVTTAQSRVWTFTGTPGGSCLVTFAPNTAQNWVFIINQSANSVILTQGSGTQATVLSGAANIVYFDGTGAGANCTLFQSTPTQGPGTVTNPSYSFTGFTDIGLYVPGAHTLGIASKATEMASFAVSGAGPSGLNTLGQTGNPSGPFIGNAFSNLDLFSGSWFGPSVPPGYCFLYLDESNGNIWVKYLDSLSHQQTAVIGNYLPGNIANFAGGAPATLAHKDYYFQVNEAKTELDFYYVDSSGITHGPIPIASYGPGNIALFTGSAPATVANLYSWFIVNESTNTLNWYYQTSGGASEGPIVIGTYGGTGGWTTYTPTFSSTTGATLVGTPLGSYIQVGKTVTLQILMEIHNTSFPGSDTYTISLPVSSYTGAGSFNQNIAAVSDNPGTITNLYNAALSGSSFTVQALLNNSGNVFIQFNGVYQSN